MTEVRRVLLRSKNVKVKPNFIHLCPYIELVCSFWPDSFGPTILHEFECKDFGYGKFSSLFPFVSERRKSLRQEAIYLGSWSGAKVEIGMAFSKKNKMSRISLSYSLKVF